MRYNSRIFLAFMGVATVAFAIACAKSESKVTANANFTETQPGQIASGETNARKAAFRAEFATTPREVRAGEAATFTFTVKDAQGGIVRDLSVVHEKPMHLLIVSDDLAEFFHLHPEPQADGSYQVAHTFAAGGNYKLYADFTPPDAAQVVDRHDLKVSGAPRPRVALAPDSQTIKTVDNLRVTLKPDKPLRAGEELMLNFAVADAKSGQPARDLQPYLGALAHFVIISEDTTDFLHAHPMEKGEQMAGTHTAPADKDHEATPHSHATASAHGEKKQAASVSEVAAHTTFPRPGLYKVWAQFQRGGRVVTVPFVVRVAGDEKKTSAQTGDAAHSSHGAVPADAIKITVSRDGYDPARVNVKRGQPVRLAFYRADAENCGGKVVFPALKIERELPVGQTTVVEITPRETGELAFTCGMSMYKGTLVIN